MSFTYPTTFKPDKIQIRRELTNNPEYYSTIERIGQEKGCHRKETFELLLYDVADAILDEQILLFDDQKICHATYLIPLLCAYKMSSTFKHFVIVTRDEINISKLKRAIDQIAKQIGLDIDIHFLDRKENFICLERLQKRSKGKSSPYRKIYEEYLRQKDKGKRNTWNLTAKQWHKIQVQHCSPRTCEFFNRCAYALQYQAINEEGCSIIRHRDLIGDDEFTSVSDKTNFVLVEQAQDLVTAVKKKYEKAINISVLTNLINRAKSYIVSHKHPFDDQKILILRDLFATLTYDFEKGPFVIDENIQNKIEALLTFLKEIKDELVTLKTGTKDNIDNILNPINDAIELFSDMLLTNHKYSYYYEPILSNDGDILNRFNIIYYPNVVDTIISSALTHFNCSIALIGSNIAGDDNEYQTIINECGLNNVPKELVKEYTKKG